MSAALAERRRTRSRSKSRGSTAALEKTIAYPIEPGLYLGDPRLILGLLLLALTALADLFRLSRQNR